MLSRSFKDDLVFPLKILDLRFTLTVPAVWSDTAKDRTLNAAIQADIRPQDITLVSEPEAAALYTLRSIQSNSMAVSNSVERLCMQMSYFCSKMTYSSFAMLEGAQW